MSNGPFSHYDAAPAAIWSAGDDVRSTSGAVDGLQSNVQAAHQPAEQGVAGLLAGPMLAAPQPVKDQLSQWVQSAVFAGGAVRLFGDGVQAYNTGVDGLNSRYWSAKANNFGVARPSLADDATAAERSDADRSYRTNVANADGALLAALRREHDNVLEPALDLTADETAGLLDRGPSDAMAVLALYEAGALPLSAVPFFPGVPFAQVPPPMSGPNGEHAADLIRKALAGEASPDEFRQAMQMLQLVSDHAQYVQQHGGYLTAGEVSFLNSFYNTLGDKIWDVPDYIRAGEHHWDAATINLFGLFDKDADGFDQNTQTWMLTSMGTGLLSLSNTDLWPPSTRSGDPMRTDSPYHLPETVISLLTNPAIRTEMQSVSTSTFIVVEADRMGDFYDLADMLGKAPDQLEAGTGFSEHLTQRVAEITFASQRFHDYDVNQPGLGLIADDFHDTDRLNGSLETLIGVSTRNDEANFRLLTGATEGPMERVSTYIDDPVIKMDNRQFLLQSLYGYDWADDGKAAAGLTDWIPERVEAAAQHNQQDPMANQAAAALIDVVTMTEKGEGNTDRVNMYDSLMHTFSEKNPEVVRSFGRVAASYLTDFSEPSGNVTRVEADGSLSLSDHDKIRFLDLVATDHDAINGLSYASGQFEQRLLVGGLDGRIEMIEVGQRSERLDGLLSAARVNAVTVGNSQEFEDASEAYKEHMRWAGLGKTAVTTVSGEIISASAKPIAPYLNAGLGFAADQVMEELLPEPERDVGFNPGFINDQGRDDTYAAYEYLSALNSTGRIDVDRIPDYMIQQGPYYPGGPSGPMYQHGHPVLVGVDQLDGGQRQELINLLEGEDHGIGGEEYVAYKNNYNAYQNYLQAVAQTPDLAQAHREGSDD